jgi:hypothetical protein
MEERAALKQTEVERWGKNPELLDDLTVPETVIAHTQENLYRDHGKPSIADLVRRLELRRKLVH